MVTNCLILLSFAAADALWWRAADLRFRRGRWALVWRVLIGLFAVAQIVYMLGILIESLARNVPELFPRDGSVAAYVWHILILPLALVGIATGRLIDWRRRRSAATPSPAKAELQTAHRNRLSRREVLAGAAWAAPPAAALVASGVAAKQLGEFRVRRVELAVPNLPKDLDGLTIAHVTDLHLGRFMSKDLAAPMADATNALDADFVAFTGDLIDATCRRVAPGIDFVRRLRPRKGLVMIEGNHDVMSGAKRFEDAIKAAGLPLLLDETATFAPGGRTPVQFLGVTWGDLKTGSELHRSGRERDLLFREFTMAALNASVRRVAAMRDPLAFPILLAHHPHAFDAAAEAGLPLVLSGHTHGGQLMLTKNIGAGPLRFRYWSGAYEKPNSRLFISNGLGSWFPLRVNAPAEIVHLTLRYIG